MRKADVYREGNKPQHITQSRRDPLTSGKKKAKPRTRCLQETLKREMDRDSPPRREGGDGCRDAGQGALRGAGKGLHATHRRPRSHTPVDAPNTVGTERSRGAGTAI